MTIYDYPNREGVVDIHPIIIEANSIGVVIIGDKKGLKYLAKLLEWMADFDQDQNDDLVGTRQHIHLHAHEQLGNYSCEVEICRADAKGTGELPDYMK